MNYKETTMVPNKLFSIIPSLKPSSTMILLIIIRQTLGWYDPKTKSRKVRDWISHKQFKQKTNLSIKTISQSIRSLIELNLVKATDYYGNELSTSKLRRGKIRIYYQCLLVDSEKCNVSYVKKYHEHENNLPITKLTSTKLTLQKKEIKKVSDYERISEILKRKNYP